MLLSGAVFSYTCAFVSQVVHVSAFRSYLLVRTCLVAYPISGMPKRAWHVNELWKTRLCSNGPGHEATYPGCIFAHSLQDLRPPDERRDNLSEAWELGRVDRFYGQLLSDSQLGNIRLYWCRAEASARPLWAIGLFLLQHKTESVTGFAYPWDFGLSADWRDLCSARGGVPDCQGYPELWPRLHRRRLAMQGHVMPWSALGHRSIQLVSAGTQADCIYPDTSSLGVQTDISVSARTFLRPPEHQIPESIDCELAHEVQQPEDETAESIDGESIDSQELHQQCEHESAESIHGDSEHEVDEVVPPTPAYPVPKPDPATIPMPGLSGVATAAGSSGVTPLLVSGHPCVTIFATPAIPLPHGVFTDHGEGVPQS